MFPVNQSSRRRMMWVVAIASLSLLASLPAAWAAPRSLHAPPVSAVAPFSPVTPRYGELRTGVAPASSNIEVPTQLWEYPTGSTAVTSPLVGDIDRDGSPDVVIGEVRSGLAAGPASRWVYALNADGTLKWKAPAKYDVGVRALVDLAGDGSVEVIASEGCHCALGGLNVYVLNGADGSAVWTYTNVYWGMGHEGTFSSPSLLDVNDDGTLDLIFSMMDRYVRALDGRNGAVLWRSEEFSHYLRTTGAMADLDRDGDPDVTGWAESGMFRALDAYTGATLWERDYGCNAPTTPAIGDVDGDGTLEIALPVAGCPWLGEPGGTFVVNGEDGSVVWINRAYDYSYRSPALTDVDGDGRLDLIDGDSDSAVAVAYRGRDGAVLWATPLAGSAWASGPLVVADIDGDGQTEALAGSDAGLVALEAATGRIEWVYPMVRVRGEAWLADLNGDGNAEILFGAGDGALHVLTAREGVAFSPRTIGYWRYQCRVLDPREDHPGIREDWLAAIGSRSAVFPAPLTKAQACATLAGPRGDDMLARARQQLMALWLNVVSGLVDEDAPIDLGSLTSAWNVGQALAGIEDILLTPTSTRADWERAKTIADRINNGMVG